MENMINKLFKFIVYLMMVYLIWSFYNNKIEIFQTVVIIIYSFFLIFSIAIFFFVIIVNKLTPFMDDNETQNAISEMNIKIFNSLNAEYHPLQRSFIIILSIVLIYYSALRGLWFLAILEGISEFINIIFYSEARKFSQR